MLDNAQDVALLHDEQVLAFDPHLGAGPLAEQDAIARLDGKFDQLPGIVTRTRADSAATSCASAGS